MTNETRNDPRNRFAPRYLPWLLGAAALIIYWLTLNRWVTFHNLDEVARISGWTWMPDVFNPVSYLVTLPFRWLPPAKIPLALNLFSAVCAALTLGLLARTVALLPHDRTDAQRKRETSVFSFLTTRASWLPPVLAAAVCGLQLAFWQHATNFTGEMFDLLLFALMVWLVAEYRLDEGESRLHWAAFIFGASLADNWAMAGFLPLFVTALIWQRGLGFFNISFLGRLFFSGLAGTLFFLLLPLLTVMSGKIPVTFWQALKPSLVYLWQPVLMFFSLPGVRHNLALMSLTSLFPVLLLAIRWKSSFGDSSRLGTAIAGLMFHAVHAVILVACIWVAFDPPFSPRHLGYFGTPCLPFSFLGALSVGYFGGYFLLVFRKIPNTKPQKIKKNPLPALHFAAVAGVSGLAALTIAGLAAKNVPLIRNYNDDSLRQYTALVEENLPRTGAIVLSDSDNPSQDQPWRLLAVQAALARDGRANDFLLLDTKALSFPAYHRYLHRKFPAKWPQIVSDTDMNPLNPHGLFALLNLLSKTNAIYYLHPSYGYYFEQFYEEPHGLVYQLKPLPEDTLLPPLPDKKLIAENNAFWARAESEIFPHIEKELAPTDPNAPQTLSQRLLDRLHIQGEQNQNLLRVGAYYSLDLNFWAVQLQHAGELDQAGANFDLAQKIDPDNVVAQINLDFNRKLRAGKTVAVDPASVTSDRFGRFHDWMEVTDANGPFDEPSFCFQGGWIHMQNSFQRQALASFARVRELAPGYLPARLLLAQLYLINHLPGPALEALQDPLQTPAKFSLGPTNSIELDILAAGAYFQQNDLAAGSRLIELEISRHPDDGQLLEAAARAYMMHGLYTNALKVINRKLAAAPDDPTWLYGKGLASLQVNASADAIAAFSRVLKIQTNNYDALFNRAVARLQTEQFDDAHADYLALQQVYSNSFQVAYGLGEIAWHQHDHAEAVRNFKIYLANANTNTPEAQTVRERLAQLEK